MLAGQIALIVAATFGGAAFYINVAEHPARMMLPADMALRQWAPSYQRGYAMQASLAIAGGLSALIQWYQDGGLLWLAGGLLMLANWPYTMLVIMPVNRRLLGPEEKPQAQLVALLQRWNRLHGLRTALSWAAVAALLTASLG